MTREGWGWTLAAVFGAGLLVTYYRGRIDSAERAAAVARADTLEHLADSLDMAARADSTAAAQAVERLADSLHHIDQGVTRAEGHSDRLTRAIAAAGDLIPKAQVLDALAAKDALIMRLRVKIVTLEADTAAMRRRWLGAASEAASWHALTLRTQAQLAAANRRSAPKWGCTAGVTGLAGVGLTAARGVNVGATVAAGFGATCGLHL